VNKKSCVLIMSGGLDSTVLLHWLKKNEVIVYGLSFDYGQRHVKELQCASYWGEKLCEEWKLISLDFMKTLGTTSALTNPLVELPEEHYTHENQKITVVPNRNMIMLSIAIGWAESLNIGVVQYAAHKNDFTIYPDCRPSFVYAMNSAAQQGTYNKVMVGAPFVEYYKSELVRLGDRYNVDFTKTWSCYKGEEKHCGKCATCQERKEAFKLAKVLDPTEYEHEIVN
jgi:7-cyano-7-deazaguanine synthase